MTTLRDVHEAFANWLALPDPERGGRPFDTVDLALASVVANRLDADPLWLFFVAAPSRGKTEVLSSLSNVDDVYPLNNLTVATFVSGFEGKGAEASLLPKVDGKCIVMKDFTTILTMHRDARAEVLAQLREIYDGAYTKDFGNGNHFAWRGKVGLLAGVTTVIDREYAFNAALGERFLLHRVRTAPDRALSRQALMQRSREPGQRQRLREVVADFLSPELASARAVIAPDIAEALCALAEFAAAARSPIHFDHRGEIESIPEPEGPARLVKQLALTAEALSAVRGEPAVSVDTYITIFGIAQDTIPASRRVFLEAVLDPERIEPATTTAIAQATEYPTQTARRYLQELTALRLVDRLPEGPGRPDRWAPSDRLLDLLATMRSPAADTTTLPVVSEGESKELYNSHLPLTFTPRIRASKRAREARGLRSPRHFWKGCPRRQPRARRHAGPRLPGADRGVGRGQAPGRAAAHSARCASANPRLLRLVRRRPRSRSDLAVRSMLARRAPGPRRDGGHRMTLPAPRVHAANRTPAKKEPQMRLLSVEETAQLLGCSRAAVRKWISQRRLAAVRVGRLVRLRSEDVERVRMEGLCTAPVEGARRLRVAAARSRLDSS